MLTFSHLTKSNCENKDNLCNIAKTSERACVRSRSQRFVSAASAKTAHSLPPSSLSSGIATLDSVGDAEGCVTHRAKASPCGGSCRRSRLMRGVRPVLQRTAPHPTALRAATFPSRGRLWVRYAPDTVFRTEPEGQSLHRRARTACVRARRWPALDIGMSGNPITPSQFYRQRQSLGVSKGGPTSPFGVLSLRCYRVSFSRGKEMG